MTEKRTTKRKPGKLEIRHRAFIEERYSPGWEGHGFYAGCLDTFFQGGGAFPHAEGGHGSEDEAIARAARHLDGDCGFPHDVVTLSAHTPAREARR